MVNNKNKLIIDWLKTYSPFSQMLISFNALNAQFKNNQISLNTVSRDEVIKAYTNGDYMKEYQFAIALYLPYDNNGNSKVNIDKMIDIEKFILWVREQNLKRNFPFETAFYMEPATNLPQLASLENHLAKYLIQFKVKYLDDFTSVTNNEIYTGGI